MAGFFYVRGKLAQMVEMNLTRWMFLLG